MTLETQDADGYNTLLVSKVACALRIAANAKTDAAAIAEPTLASDKRQLVLAIAIHKEGGDRTIATWLTKSMVAGGLTLAASDATIQSAVNAAFPKVAFVFDPPVLGA